MRTLDLTEALVRVDTVSHRPTGPAVALLVPALREAGCTVRLHQVQRGDTTQTNLLARRGEGAGGLLLGGHIDTVPWQEGTRATIHPQRDADVLYGRGSCDMKGGIAACVEAARRTRDLPHRRALSMAFTFEEEVGCHGARLMMDELSHDAEFAIVGEPTSLAPVHQHKGYLAIDIELSGEAAHASAPRNGVSCSWLAAALLAELRELELSLEGQAGAPQLDPPWTTLNVGTLRVGTARNVVAPRGWIQLELRPLPGQDTTRLIDRVRAAARRAESKVRGGRIQVHPQRAEAALSTPPEARLLAWLTDQTGHQPSGVPFYTEGPQYARTGAEVAICGPGAIDVAHQPDEHVPLADLEGAAALYSAAIREFCG